jgi:hypothetical protein
MIKLFIENKELDINQQFSQQITYAIDDLQNVDSKSTSFTKTIVLPGTSNNNRLLGNIFEFANSNFTDDTQPNVGYNFNAAKSAQAVIDVDGLPVMKGVIRLLEILIDGDYIEYEVAMFGELGGLFFSFGAKKLEELDFSVYNHSLTITEIEDSWDNANAGEGYYYPLIDYGNCSPIANALFAKKNWYLRAFRPALFVREYMDKIISGAGYTWESDFMDTDYFKSLIIPNNAKQLYKYTNYGLDIAVTGFGYTNADGGSKAVTFGIQNVLNGFTPNGSNNLFTYAGSEITAQINLRFKGTYIKSASSPFAIEVRKNGVSVASISFAPSAAAVTTAFDVDITNIGITYNNGDTIAVFLVGPGSGTWNLSLSTGQSYFQLVTRSLIPDELTLNEFIPINDTIPRGILQKDFFTSVLKMFNLMVIQDKDKDKHLKLIPYIDFYNTDSSTYLDWSDKVDRSQVIKIKPMSEVTARYYQFKYKTDSDFFNDDYRKKYNEGYGDRIFDNQLEFTKDTQSVEVIFSATPLVGYVDRDKVISTIYKKTNGVEESTDHNIRILRAKKITGAISWKIYSTTNTELLTTSVFPYAGHLDDPDIAFSDLNFGVAKELYFDLVTGGLQNNLFNIFYSGYFGEIIDKDSRLLTCKMHFKPSDIYNLDFSRFIWLDGVLYRLVKIKDYSDNEICDVELLRLIYTEFESPYFVEYNIGDRLNGGYIGYIEPNNKNGLIVADGLNIDYTQRNWSNSIAYCDSFTDGGYTDWRIGTIQEMLLIDPNNPLIPDFYQENYWSGTEFNDGTGTQAWRISMIGTGGGDDFVLKTDTYLALPIKSF